LRGKLGADGGIGDYVPKPKWMRWPTYDRKLEEIFAAEEVVDAHLLGFVQKARAPFETMKPTCPLVGSATGSVTQALQALQGA
jgi:hypothetical protein